ncbi:hypothetical protein AB0O91_09000 [Kitasatospora sp. NPDC089797]
MTGAVTSSKNRRAIAAGAWAPDPVDPLEFGLARILDGVQLLLQQPAAER